MDGAIRERCAARSRGAPKQDVPNLGAGTGIQEVGLKESASRANDFKEIAAIAGISRGAFREKSNREDDGSVWKDEDLTRMPRSASKR